MGWILLIILDVLTVAWLIHVLQEFPRTNKVILDLQNRSHDLTFVERIALQYKIQRSQTDLDSSMTFFAIAIVINCMVGFYQLIVWGFS